MVNCNANPIPNPPPNASPEARKTPEEPSSNAFYRGRFAPSPTGPLHFGSLVTALASFLQARRHKGEWQLRIDDIDPGRDTKAALGLIPRQLDAFGLDWDGPITYQSRHEARHREALQTLLDQTQAFRCGCTRREIAAIAEQGADGPIYPGTCRNGLPAGKTARSVRVKVDAARVGFDDPLQGRIATELAREVGDFIIKRADGLIAYQLAAAVDDADAGFTEVVRGADLLPSTLRQIWLHRCLGLPSPNYMHLPVAVNADGAKLSKQTRARALDASDPSPPLLAALAFLGQRPPAELVHYAPSEILDWATARWEPTRLRGVPRKVAPKNPPAPRSPLRGQEREYYYSGN